MFEDIVKMWHKNHEKGTNHCAYSTRATHGKGRKESKNARIKEYATFVLLPVACWPHLPAPQKKLHNFFQISISIYMTNIKK